jgi:shikimate kinase
LVGLRAAGKTSVGRVLAELLGCDFVDLDQVLVERARQAGRSERSVGELLVAMGEGEFRDLEAAVLAQALARPAGAPSAAVIATGGGVVERSENRTLLCQRARTIWLDVPTDLLRARLARDPTPRPALLGRSTVEEVDALCERRAPLYRSVAEHVIDCGTRSPQELARELARLLG